ncbi:MAG: zf-HC2 domain-containing protein [Candidatus Cloacimonetes bacterium]|nr:zf-HC2 domain-containing protein [Candidatus Cloacimonadota bacterium]
MKGKIKCKKVIQILNAFIDNELSREDKMLVAEHLLSCKSCRKEYDSLNRINELLFDFTTEPLPSTLRLKLLSIPQKEIKKTFRTNLLRRYISIPAAAAILLTLVSAITLGLLYQNSNIGTQSLYNDYQIAQQSFYTIWEGITYE